MSAGVSDQRMKGQGNQVSNGPKEQLGAGEGATGSEEFEPWRSQQQNSAAHTAYGASVPISTATDLYTHAGYYGSGATYPYQAYGVGDGTWSNGTDPMTFLSGYPHDSYSMDGMFGPSTTFSTATPFGQPSSFNYFPSNGDYSTWSSQRKYDDYYRDAQNMYTQAMPDSTIKIVEQAMQNLDLKTPSGDCKDSLGQQKKTTWASIASQPAKPQLTVQNQGLKKKGPGMPPGPIVPGKHNMDIGTWDTKNTPPQLPVVNNAIPKAITPTLPVRQAWNGPPANRAPPVAPRPAPQHPQHPMQSYQPPAMMPPHLPPAVTMPTGSMIPGGGPVPLIMAPNVPTPSHPVLDELRGKNNYNPTEFDLTAPNARFFVIKSYSEDDIHRSIKYEIWCSTEHGNKRLDTAYRERESNGAVYLFFSVNGSGHFCGMAQMVSPVDYHSNSPVWSQDKWKGQFKVRWVYVKDVPNVQLRHIRLENNENKPVTNSRDTQEVPHARGLQVLRIMHSYRHSTSIFDDFVHYEKRQEEEDSRKQPEPGVMMKGGPPGHHEGPGGPGAGHGGGGGGRERGERGEHRGGRGGHERDGDKDGHRPGHRNTDHHGGHHKERNDNNRGRGGRGGRN